MLHHNLEGVMPPRQHKQHVGCNLTGSQKMLNAAFNQETCCLWQYNIVVTCSMLHPMLMVKCHKSFSVNSTKTKPIGNIMSQQTVASALHLVLCGVQKHTDVGTFYGQQQCSKLSYWQIVIRWPISTFKNFQGWVWKISILSHDRSPRIRKKYTNYWDFFWVRFLCSHQKALSKFLIFANVTS